ncbi:Cytochrome P450, family 88, subfamily A, polypeptide 3 isoform 1 [Hibiscus syriacus]|uniref:Cytochrome P450, family 88, subfamily A, polypeptide 3 isoform 1 n=1 Tax=Hibiscus syriacus TaxID=106335 RepID=A0A6A3BDH8_HIBSY|nr:21 kDa protein-like [Hibiscus syriacus]KAE8712849.1 Cytochrome P450, family 88, subfamily A, polypeptide 3 isoform 1 [Hibiscus syriacus]
MAIGSHFSPAAILILILFTTHPNCLSARKILSSDTDTEFIKTSCDATTYPDLCFATFSSYATEIQADPKILAAKSLSVALNTTLWASQSLTDLSKTQGLKPKEEAALHDCVEEMSDSVDELRRSISEMEESEGKSFALRMSDVETWVSAALTDEDTCMDGFSENEMDGDVKATVTTTIENVAQLTSISLAFVNQYAGSK